METGNLLLDELIKMNKHLEKIKENTKKNA